MLHVQKEYWSVPSVYATRFEADSAFFLDTFSYYLWMPSWNHCQYNSLPSSVPCNSCETHFYCVASSQVGLHGKLKINFSKLRKSFIRITCHCSVVHFLFFLGSLHHILTKASSACGHTLYFLAYTLAQRLAFI